MKRDPRTKTALVAIAFLLPFGVYAIDHFHLFNMTVPEPIQHLVLAFAAVMGVHLLDRLGWLGETRELIKMEVSAFAAERRDLIKLSASLDAMVETGISRIYTSRADASSDMQHDIEAPGVTHIELIGISMNDFLAKGGDTPLRKAWLTLKDYIEGHQPIKFRDRGAKLSIRILIIDPECFGAQLRAVGEQRDPQAVPGRLSGDVTSVGPQLRDLISKAKELAPKTGVNFDCHLYRLPPQLFVCRTDTACYVQPYHFWKARNDRTPIPTLKYRKLTEAGYDMHKEIGDHFEWIWNRASISHEAFFSDYMIGCDKGLIQIGAKNVFTNEHTAQKRIKRMLGKATTKVWIQGISLHSFFGGASFSEWIWRLVREGSVSIKVLILDPDCEQAIYRSYREMLLNRDPQSLGPADDFDKYREAEDHKRSKLYLDTKLALGTLRSQIFALREEKRKEGVTSWNPKIEVRIYESAPVCFMLRVDSSILVEQYTYGKIRKIDDKIEAILGRDMPLFEYAEEPDSLYHPDSVPERSPFALLTDHFDFAFNQARRVEFQ
jgi:hypothetical protein